MTEPAQSPALHRGTVSPVTADEPRPHAAAPAFGSVGWQVQFCRRLPHSLASLKLTVVLFALAIFLTYAGTVAQKEHGVGTILTQYFRTGLARVEIEPLFLYTVHLPAWMPKDFYFPGGWLIGGMMLINLIAAHVTRFNVKVRGAKLWNGLAVLAVGSALIGLLVTDNLGVEPGGLSGFTSDWAIMLGIVAVMLTGARMLFNRRAGVVIAHAGLIVLLLSELITGLFAIEGIMPIMNGGAVNYIEVISKPELVVVDRSPADYDREVCVPGSFLAGGGTIRDDRLPFDVEVVDFMKNSELVQPGEGIVNPATAGSGLQMIARRQPEESGAGAAERQDAASAYIRVVDKQTHKPVGTYLVSYFFDHDFGARDLPQHVTLGGKTYDMALRFTRVYQPYTVKLLEFRHQLYPGTMIAKDYSSFIQLTDPSRRVDRRVRIWMNHPLRYHNQTLYQQSVLGQDQGTILQVVQNPGWAVPYISCLMVAGGLIVHFGQNLSTFLRRRAAA